MKIAQQLKEKNIAEYLIYMWQVEDLLRANGCDIDRIRQNIILRYPEEERPALEEWYGNLADMMRAEGVTEKGHLQINRNVILNLTELHGELLASTKYPFYNAAYFKALPFIVELRQKNGRKEESEVDTCFEALYGVLLLRLQKKEISQGTAKAMAGPFRCLRAAKNRFGSTNEIGVFEMSDRGLLEVQNPSAAMLAGHPTGASGNCIACVMEGSRPLLAEVQALVAKTQFGVPRRTAAGVDYNRMVLLLAILEKRAGLFLSGSDAYVNVVGGMRLDEPAADLPMVLAITSSFRDKPLPEGVMSFGEVGLTGELRAVSCASQRIWEAYRLGFHTCIVPDQDVGEVPEHMNVVKVKTVQQALQAVL